MLRSFLAIIAGVLIAVIITLPILILVAFNSFSDVRLPKSQELFNIILWLCGIAGGALAGGYFASKISLRSPYTHAIFTGVTLIFLYLLISNFDLRYLAIEELISIPFLIIFTVLGAYLYTKRKKIISKSDSFLSDTPSQ